MNEREPRVFPEGVIPGVGDVYADASANRLWVRGPDGWHEVTGCGSYTYDQLVKTALALAWGGKGEP